MKESQLPVPAMKSNGFRWMNADAYLFDIDGTLLTSRDGVHRSALHEAMRQVYGFDTTIDGIAYHGKTDVGILRAALQRVGVSDHTFQAKLPEALAVVRSHVSENASRLAPVRCSSIQALLTELQAAGKLLGLASGNLESVGWMKVRAAGLNGFFSFGTFCDSNENRADIFREAVLEAQRRLGPTA